MTGIPIHRDPFEPPFRVVPVSRAGKVCSNPTCPNVQPCPIHARAPWEGSTRRQRLPPDWDQRRQFVLRRDPICMGCGLEPSAEVDHRERGDDHDVENLQGLCGPCHQAKTQAEAAAARRARS